MLVNVLLRLLFMGVLASLPGSPLLSWDEEEGAAVDRPLEALLERERVDSALPVEAAEGRG